MSYIFDALQRSQTERTKIDKPGSLAAIELLEQAERQATAEWNSEPSAGQGEKSGTEHRSRILSGEGFGPVTAEADPIEIAHALQQEEHREVFSQFQTLEISQARQSQLVCLANGDSPAKEAFHLLGVRLRNLQKERALRSLLITSTVPQEGKSFVAANLACTLGFGTGQKVLLLEGDARRPSQSQLFGFANVSGIGGYLREKRSLTASLYHLAGAGIWILPAGDNPGGTLDLTRSPQLPALMATLNSLFDWILIDSPPVLPLADTSVWARQADGILLVARPGTTQKKKLRRGLEALAPNKLIGVLLNSSKSTIDNDYYYYRHATKESEHSGAAAD
jgi:capsular exopolysaccharide synthesis family protein